MLSIDPEKVSTVEQMFRLYVERKSDFAVRDWLKAHQIKAPGGSPVWAVGTIRDLLTNRRYVAEIEINKQNKDQLDVPALDAYRVVKAPHEPVVSLELFEIAQAIRRDKAQQYPNNPGQQGRNPKMGKARSYTWSQCDRVYPLQGVLTCAYCGSPMSPHYVFHKAGKQRRRDSYIHHYVCTMHRKYGKDCNHSNRILAKTAEAWLLDRISQLENTPGLLEQAVESARLNCEGDLQPVKDALALNRTGLEENQQEIDTLIRTISSGTATGALMSFLNERAHELKVQRETLRAEQRHLMGLLTPLSSQFNADRFRKVLSHVWTLSAAATPLELQQLLQLAVARLDWGPDGTHRLVLHDLPTKIERLPVMAGESVVMPVSEAKTNQPQPLGGQDWFDISMGSGCPRHRNVEPIFLHLIFVQHTVLQLDLSLFTSYGDSVPKPPPSSAAIINSRSAGSQQTMQRERERA